MRVPRALRQVATLAGGTASAQALSLLAAPVASRLYGPEPYGLLASSMSISSVAGTAATLLLHSAVVLTKDDDDARTLVGLAFASSVVVAALTLGLVLVVGPGMAESLGDASLRWWLLAAPFSVLASGATASLTAWANRRTAYRAISASRLLAAVLQVALSLSMGFTFPRNPTGLFVSLWASQWTTAGVLVIATRASGLSWRRIPGLLRSRGRRVFAEHKRFPIYSLPADLLFTYTQWLPVHLLVGFSGAEAVGAYSMANRLLGTPLSLVGTSVSDVFRQRAARDVSEHGHCRPLFVKAAAALGAGSLVVFGPLMLLAPVLLPFALGDDWGLAGTFAAILCPLYFARFVVSPLASVYYLRNRHAEDLALHVAMIVVVVAAMSAGHHLLGAAKGPLIGYVAAYSLIYAIYAVRSHQLAGPQS